MAHSLRLLAAIANTENTHMHNSSIDVNDNSLDDNHNHNSDSDKSSNSDKSGDSANDKPTPPRSVTFAGDAADFISPDASDFIQEIRIMAPASENSPRTGPAESDPGGLFARFKDDPKFKISTLSAGPERMVLVIAAALRSTLANERYAQGADDDEDPMKTYPTLVVRERPASDSGKFDNATDWTVLGVYRHVQLLDGAAFEFVEEGTRLTRDNNATASLVMRTTGAIRIFEHEDDEKVSERSYFPC